MNRTVLITLVIIVVVGGLAFFQKPTGSTLVDLASNKIRTDQPEGNKAGEAGAHGKVVLPKPQGSKTAPIKICVYVTSDNSCDSSTLSVMQEVQSKHPDKVYVEYLDLLDPAVKRQAEKMKIGCKSGLTINGKNRFLLPERGLKGTLMFDGPVGQKNYNAEDIEAVVQFLLKHPPKNAPKAPAKSSAG